MVGSVEDKGLVGVVMGCLRDDFLLVARLHHCGAVAEVDVRFAGFQDGAIVILYLSLD